MTSKKQPQKKNRKKTVNLDTYAIIANAVIEGVAWGLKRAHKHTDTPSRDELHNRIVDEVMLQLDAVLLWDLKDEY